MNKTLLMLTFGCLLASGSASANTWDEFEGKTWSGTVNEKGTSASGATSYTSENWMAALPGNLYVAHVTIPGSHDSVTGGDGDQWISSTGNNCSTTQAAELDEMMARGIRALDLRPGLDDGKLYCHHGLDQLKLTLTDAMDKVLVYLDAHPTEFFVIHLFRGNVYSSRPDGASAVLAKYSESDKATYNKLMGEIFNTGKVADKVVTFSPDLKVSDVRGKIVLLRRDRINFVDLPKAGYLTNWTEEFDVNNAGAVFCGGNPLRSTKVHMQDLSQGDDTVRDKKIVQSKALMDWAMNQTNPNEATGIYNVPWVFNFTSIENSGTSVATDNTNGYKGGASVMNRVVADYINAHKGQGPLGIFYSDYVLRTSTKKVSSSTRYNDIAGDEIVYNLIQNNYEPDASGKSVVERFTLSDAIVNSGQVFIRNVGTGKFLSGGANWGSHAIVDDSGEPVELVRIGSHYSLRSDYGYMYTNDLGYLYMDGNESNASKVNVINTTYNAKNHIIFETYHGDQQRYVRTFNYVEDKIACDYWFNPEYFVDTDANLSVSPKILWEVVSKEDRYNEIKTLANKNRPMGCDFLIPASKFGNKDVDNANWIVWQNNKDYSYVYRWENEKGPFYLMITQQTYSRWPAIFGSRSEWSLTSPTRKLPWKGKYRFKCQAASSTENVTLTVKGQSVKFANEEISNNITNEAAGAWFKAGNGVKTIEFTTASENEDFQIVLKKGSNTTPTATIFGNMTLEYLGEDPEAETTITLTFPEHYNTFMLPFDMKEAEYNALKSDGIEICNALDLSNKEAKIEVDGETMAFNYHLVSLSDGLGVSEIKANVPYVAINTEIPKSALQVEKIVNKAPAKAAATKEFSFTGLPTNRLNQYTDDSKILTGVHEADVAAGEHYFAGTHESGAYQYFRQDTEAGFQSIDAHRAYIKNDTDNKIYPLIVFDDEAKITTGVEDVVEEAEAVTAETPTDVYTISGMIVRSQVPYAEALSDLPAGIYIVRAGSRARVVAL